MQFRIQEIKDFIQHQDYSLAIRRMLDLCLDTNNENILQQALNLSKYFHHIQSISEKIDDKFLHDAYSLLDVLQNTASAITNNTPLKLVTVEGVSKTYNRGNFSLKPISLTVNSGNIIGIVGENGNGKTTFLRCLARQLHHNTGSLLFHQINSLHDYDIKHSIAFIPQRIPRWYGLLKDNLHFSASLSGVVGKQNELLVEYMLERLSLSKYANLTWNQISSGYRTRFEMARILLQKPSLLILDEPLANLDINAQQTILTDLKYMAQSTHHKMGVILSSQQLHEVEKVADTVLFIKQGSCLFKTNESQVKELSFAIEVETKSSREELQQALENLAATIQYNGGYYTIESVNANSNEMVATLIQNNIQLSYFRDITHSTKRYF